MGCSQVGQFGKPMGARALALLLLCGGCPGDPSTPDAGAVDGRPVDLQPGDGSISDRTVDDGRRSDGPPGGDLGSAPGGSWAVPATGPENDNGEGIALDHAGNVYVAGRYKGQLTIGSTVLSSKGEHDIFLVKLTADGKVIWAVSTGGDGDDRGLAVAVDPTSGDAYVTGYFSTQVDFGPKKLTASDVDVFVARYAATDGHVVWATSAGGTGDDRAFGIAVDGSGNPYVTGAFELQAAFGTKTLSAQGSWDVFVAQLGAADGSVSWATGMGGGSYDLGRDVALDPSGNIYVTGSCQGDATFGPDILTNQGNQDLFVAKLSPAGTVLWGKGWPKNGPESEKGNAIAVDRTTGEVYVTGYVNVDPGRFDAVLAKFSPTGQSLWDATGGGSGWTEGLGVDVDPGGNIYVTGILADPGTFGNINLPNNGGWDIFVARWTPDGKVNWAISTGASLDDAGNSIAVGTSAGGVAVHVTGEFGGAVPFGTQVLTSNAQSRDAFIWKIRM